MTGTVTLADEGQEYVEFEIVCDVIDVVHPSELHGWKGTKILNKEYVLGGKLLFDLQWKDYNVTLNQPITDIKYQELYGSEWLLANMTKVKVLRTNPVSYIDHWTYTAYCHEIPFYFDCVNHAAIAAAEATLNIEEIPAPLIEDVDFVQLVDERYKDQPETIAVHMQFGITIFNNHIVDYGMIAHEATHAWATDKWGRATPPYDTDYVEVIRFSGEAPITEYAKTNYAEDLAETGRYYTYSPAFLKAQCPLRYGIFEHMMTDPDYYG